MGWGGGGYRDPDAGLWGREPLAAAGEERGESGSALGRFRPLCVLPPGSQGPKPSPPVLGRRSRAEACSCAGAAGPCHPVHSRGGEAPSSTVPLPASLRAALGTSAPYTALWGGPEEGAALTSLPSGLPCCPLGFQLRSFLP